MSNIFHLSELTKSHDEIEYKITIMSKLQRKIKELESEYSMLKAEVITEYFHCNEEFKTAKGMVLATYKVQTQSVFNSAKFKLDYPRVYENYKEEKQIHKFLLK